ncbi:hypothetical protein QQP08_013602 [Theobroma cacao]|nr:hypothetical protein QQP08_013602 [Theobroma cacao]
MVREEPKQNPEDSSKQFRFKIAKKLIPCLVPDSSPWQPWGSSLCWSHTPDRQSKHKKRSDLILKTPPSTTSRRKRRAQSRSPVSTPITPLNLDEEGTSKQGILLFVEKSKRRKEN